MHHLKTWIGFTISALIFMSSTAFAVNYEVDPALMAEQQINPRMLPLTVAMRNAGSWNERLVLVRQQKAQVIKDIEAIPYFDINDKALELTEPKEITLSRLLTEYQNSLDQIPENMTFADCKRVSAEASVESESVDYKADPSAWTQKILAEICR